MPALQDDSLKAKRACLETKIREVALADGVSIDDLSWGEPPLGKDVSVLTITSRGKRYTEDISRTDLLTFNESAIASMAKKIVGNCKH